MPKELHEAILKHKILKYFPEKFTIKPFDNSKDYQWHPDIIKLDLKEMQKFIEDFDWS